MLTNIETSQEDPDNGDDKKLRSVRSRSRVITGPNPQVNWRVDEGVKQEIEEQARRRGVGAGEIIKELWRSQHAELLTVVQEILHVVTQAPVIPTGAVGPSPGTTAAPSDATQRWLADASPRPVVTLRPRRPWWQRFCLWWVGR